MIFRAGGATGQAGHGPRRSCGAQPAFAAAVLLPLAGIEDMVGVLVFLVILIISAISQMVGKAKEAQQQQQRPRPPVRPVQPAANPQDPVARELDDFLRRAASGGKAPAPHREAAARPQARPTAAPARPRTPAVPVARPVPAQPLAKPVLAQPVSELEEIIEPSLADRLSQPDEDRFRRKTRQPFAEIADFGEQRVGEQVRPDLGQKMGHLSSVPEPLLEPLPPTAAAGLAAMLTSRTTLRQAILVSEILERPEHRWT